MKKTYIAPALQPVELDIESPILNASDDPGEGYMNANIDNEDRIIDNASEPGGGAWTNKRGGWSSSDWSGN